MKIAIIIRRLNVRGGAQRQALLLARELQKQGQDVTVYSVFPGWDESYPELVKGLKIIHCGAGVSMSHVKKSILKTFFWERRLARVCAKAIDPGTELLNPHDQLAYKIACEFKKRVKPIPSVWMMNDLPTKWFSLWREGECGAKKPSTLKLVLAKIFDRIDVLPYAQCQDAIAVLDNRDAEWVRYFFGKKATVIRSGVDSERIPYYVHPQPKPKILSVLLTGIALPHRRFEDAIDAVALLRKEGYDVRVDIIGDESQSREYVDFIKKRVSVQRLGEYVRFLGRVSEDELARAYREHDLFLFPNHLQSWGLAVFEAMAAGLPVVVSKTAGASEVLTHGVNVLLVEPKNPQSIAEALRRLIDEPGLREMLSKRGREYVERTMSWEKYARNMLELFDSVLSHQS